MRVTIKQVRQANPKCTVCGEYLPFLHDTSKDVKYGDKVMLVCDKCGAQYTATYWVKEKKEDSEEKPVEELDEARASD